MKKIKCFPCSGNGWFYSSDTLKEKCPCCKGKGFTKVKASKREKVRDRDPKYQCCSCENTFDRLKDRCCPICKSGNWVRGYIDEEEVVLTGKTKREATK